MALPSSSSRPISSSPIPDAGRSTLDPSSRSRMRPSRRVWTQIRNSIGTSYPDSVLGGKRLPESTTRSVPPPTLIQSPTTRIRHLSAARQLISNQLRQRPCDGQDGAWQHFSTLLGGSAAQLRPVFQFTYR